MPITFGPSFSVVLSAYFLAGPFPSRVSPAHDLLWLFFAGPKLSPEELEREKSLVEKARTDPDAFGVLYEQNYDRILNFVLRRTASVEIAQDITAETFFKALKGLGQYRWQNIPFQSWLYRIALNEIALWHRKNYRPSVSLTALREQGFDPASEQDLEGEVLAAERELERHQDYLLAQKMLSQLPERYREALFLRYFAELPLQEVATILDKPTGTVKSLLHRGLEKLEAMVTGAKLSATNKQNQHYKS